MRRILVIIILVLTLFQTVIYAQSSEADEIKTLFEDQGKVWWVRHYKGLVNDMHDINITLGFDGEEYHGYATYLRSKTRFQLYGKAGTKFKLYEIDQSGKVSGILEGRVSPQLLKVNWHNYQNTVGVSMRLTKADADDSELTSCGHNKWAKNYEGNYMGKNTCLLIQHYAEGEYRGFFYIAQENKTYHVEGTQKLGEDRVYLHLMNEKNEKKGRLDCKEMGANRVDCTFRNDEGVFANQLTHIQTVDTEGIELMDYTIVMDVTYPKIKSKESFNAIIYQQYDKWLQKNRSQTAKESKHIKENPDNRAMMRAYGWYDIEYLSSKYVSLRLNYADNWTDYEEIVWTYDLESQKTMQPEDLFLENSGYAEFVREYIMDVLKKYPEYKDEDYSKWVEKENFEFFSLRHEGINFSTKNNPIYGVRNVTVPYYKLKPYLKKVIY